MQLLRIGTEAPQAGIDVGVDDDVRLRRAVEQVAHIDDLLVSRRKIGGGRFVVLRTVQHLSAQDGSAFDGPMQPFDDHGADMRAFLGLDRAAAARSRGDTWRLDLRDA